MTHENVTQGRVGRPWERFGEEIGDVVVGAAVVDPHQPSLDVVTDAEVPELEMLRRLRLRVRVVRRMNRTEVVAVDRSGRQA